MATVLCALMTLGVSFSQHHRLPITGTIPDQVGWGSGQLDLVEDVPSPCKGTGLVKLKRSLPRKLFYDPVILWSLKRDELLLTTPARARSAHSALCLPGSLNKTSAKSPEFNGSCRNIWHQCPTERLLLPCTSKPFPCLSPPSLCYSTLHSIMLTHIKEAFCASSLQQCKERKKNTLQTPKTHSSRAEGKQTMGLEGEGRVREGLGAS